VRRADPVGRRAGERRDRHRAGDAGRAGAGPRRGERSAAPARDRAPHVHAPQAGRSDLDAERPRRPALAARVPAGGFAALPGRTPRRRHERTPAPHQRRRPRPSPHAPEVRRGQALSRPPRPHAFRVGAPATPRRRRVRAGRVQLAGGSLDARSERRRSGDRDRDPRGPPSAGAPDVRGAGSRSSPAPSLRVWPAQARRARERNVARTLRGGDRRVALGLRATDSARRWFDRSAHLRSAARTPAAPRGRTAVA